MKKLNIQSKRIQIRNLLLSDLDNFYYYRSNPDVTKYQGFDVMNLKQAKDFIKKQTLKLFGKPDQWVQYAIVLEETQQLIGDCAIKISSLKNGTASIGITISNKEQKKGYAKEVLQAICGFLFDKHQAHRIVESLSEENIASERLLKSCGFRKEGHFLSDYFQNGKWINSLQYALLKSEWLILKKIK